MTADQTNKAPTNAAINELAEAFVDVLDETRELRRGVRQISSTNDVIMRIVVALGLFFLIQAYSLYQIVSCTNPSGACAKRGQKATATAIVAISVRSELARNETELEFAEARGDQAAVVFRTQKVQENQAALNALTTAVSK